MRKTVLDLGSTSFPYILVSIRPRECPLTIIFPILPFPNILVSISVSHNTKTIWFPILPFTFIYTVSVFISKSFPNYTRRGFPSVKCLLFFITGSYKRRKKKEWDEDDEWMFHLVSYKWFRITQYIPQFGGVLQEMGIPLGDCLTLWRIKWGLLTGDDVINN